MSTEQLNIIVPGLTTVAGAAIGALIAYLVGRQQFKATVISANRQAWINTLRDTVAEYQSCVGVMSFLLVSENLANMINSSEFRERLARVEFLRSKIRLLINPNEADHVKLVEIISEPVAGGLTDESLKRIGTARDEIAMISQKILKREWERVKRGR